MKIIHKDMAVIIRAIRGQEPLLHRLGRNPLQLEVRSHGLLERDIGDVPDFGCRFVEEKSCDTTRPNRWVCERCGVTTILQEDFEVGIKKFFLCPFPLLPCLPCDALHTGHDARCKRKARGGQ